MDFKSWPQRSLRLRDSPESHWSSVNTSGNLLLLPVFRAAHPRAIPASCFVPRTQREVEREFIHKGSSRYASVSVYYTATVILEGETLLSTSYHSHRTKPSNIGCQTSRPPPGPAVIYVCRESRRVVLKRYTLAFGKTNTWIYPPNLDEDWERSQLGKPRVWVDFERDTISLACITALTPHRKWGHLAGCLVNKIGKRSPSEASLIRSLAVGGHWSRSPAGQGGHIPFLYLRTHIDRGLGDNLRMVFQRMKLNKFHSLQEFTV